MVHLLIAVIYLSFISLGLPDALLGAAWPTMYLEFQVPVSYAGGISMTIAAGTIVSSLLSDRITRKLGAGKVTALSVGMTALALFGFSVSHSYWSLILWAIPYGLGAGSVDAALNNYVALHYSSRHMSWLHCMWGIGAAAGPYFMEYALAGGHGWTMGYRYITILQIVLTAIILLSLPLWKTRSSDTNAASDSGSDHALSLREITAIPGAKEILVAFFCYCAIEQTAGLWSSSYLVLFHGLSEEIAAGYACLFYIGITVGRALNGFLTAKYSDKQLIRLGFVIIAIGIAAFLLPFGSFGALSGIVLVGLGCAPVYPCIIHSTPHHFGAERSQAMIGVQMATAYIGTLLMPSLFGLIANNINIALFPVYLLIILVLMALMYELVLKKTADRA